METINSETGFWVILPRKRSVDLSLISMSKWTDYYRKLPGDGQEPMLLIVEPNGTLMEKTIHQEIEIAARKMKRTKPARPHGVAIEVLRDNVHMIPVVVK